MFTGKTRMLSAASFARISFPMPITHNPRTHKTAADNIRRPTMSQENNLDEHVLRMLLQATSKCLLVRRTETGSNRTQSSLELVTDHRHKLKSTTGFLL